MSYNPYRHAAELGVTVEWADSCAESTPGSYDPATNCITLCTELDAREARSWLALFVAFAEQGGANTPSEKMRAAHRALNRLVDRAEYQKIAALFKTQEQRAYALGTIPEVIEFYEKHTWRWVRAGGAGLGLVAAVAAAILSLSNYTDQVVVALS